MTQASCDRVSLPDTETRLLHSDITGRLYRLLSAKPKDYDASDRNYPILYLLDANAHFGLVTQLVRTLQVYREVPQMIIVGVSYDTDHKPDVLALRLRDYTPTEIEGVAACFDERYRPYVLRLTRLPRQSGGGADFLAFFRQELQPYIEGVCRVEKQQQGLAGWSLGGLFALYALLQAPDTFGRYLVMSPSIWWNNKVLLRYEAQFAAAGSHLPARLFLSTPALESERMVGDVHELAKVMQESQYEGLTVTSPIFADESHLSVVGGAFARGMRILFAYSRLVCQGADHEN